MQFLKHFSFGCMRSIEHETSYKSLFYTNQHHLVINVMILAMGLALTQLCMHCDIRSINTWKSHKSLFLQLDICHGFGLYTLMYTLWFPNFVFRGGSIIIIWYCPIYLNEGLLWFFLMPNIVIFTILVWWRGWIYMGSGKVWFMERQWTRAKINVLA